MGARGSSQTSFDVYIYQLSDSGSVQKSNSTKHGTRRTHASRTMTRKQRDRAALRLKRRASDYLAQAGELRKVVAHLSTPENLMSPVVFKYFESLIPRLNSIYQITDHFRKGFKKNHFPSGMGGLEFLLRVVKNLIRQIESALAVAELEAERCRRRPAYFDLYRLLEQAARSSQNHYLDGEVGLTVNPSKDPLQIRGKRALWNLALVDLLCRAEELSPRKGIAARLKNTSASSVTLTLVPRGALVSAEEARVREHRQKFLGRSNPKGDPAFQVTQTIINLLGGKLTIGKKYRSYIMPLFTLEIPRGWDQENS